MSKSTRTAAKPTRDVTLETVRTRDEIRENFERFNRDAGQHWDRVLQLASQTTFWIFDEDADAFAPNKFVGFKSMTFPRYEAALAGNSTGAAFNGGVARVAIERVLGPYVPDPALTNRLGSWLIQTSGRDTLGRIATTKWKFVRLQPRQYWALVCNPDRFDGLTALSQLEHATWLFERGNARVGDRAIIWQAKGSGSERGVIACVEITSEPSVMEELPEEQPFWVSARPGPERRCRIHVLPAAGLPLWESQNAELLSPLAAARARGGTVFSLEREQWDAIWETANQLESIISSAPARGQGFQPDAECRRAIELHAQRLGEEHFASNGYEVADVSKTNPYDLLCQRGSEELHVEAKGTTGDGNHIILTRNEVEHARRNNDQVALVVVSGITVSKVSGAWIAEGGTIRVHLPWDIDAGTLTPIGFTYKLPGATDGMGFESQPSGSF